MKKFIFTVLCTAVFFLGLGGLFEKASAKFKSDEKALVLIRQARQAIGGDTNLNNVRSFSATGKISKTLNLETTTRVEQGVWELNLQLPNQMSRMMWLGNDNGNGERQERVEKNVVIIKRGDGENKTFEMPEPANGGEKKIVIIKKGDTEPTVLQGDAANGELKKMSVEKDVRVFANGDASRFHQTEMFRMTLALLLTAPENTDVDYIYAGEATVDGASCDIVEARNVDSAVKLFLDKSSHLPKMISFQAAKPMILHFDMDKANPNADKKQTLIVRTKEAPEMTEFQIKLSDYRNVSGVQMPHKWTQTIGGADDETIEVTNYEINPANIQEKFNQMPAKDLFKRVKTQ